MANKPEPVLAGAPSAVDLASSETEGEAPADYVLSLFRTYGGMVYARCRQILKDKMAAEDATQETFVKAQMALRRGRPLSPVSWLYSIATNHCLSELRRWTISANSTRRLDDSDGQLTTASPEDRDIVIRLLRELDEPVAATAWLCHVDGMTQEEAAEVLGVSRRTVYDRLEKFAERGRRLVQRG
jgi:RNA polymerase sigma-70 factor, ECF subfamily